MTGFDERSGRARGRFTTPRLATAVSAILLALPSAGSAQELSGTLLDAETEQPVALGLVMMYTEAGDSVDSTITDGLGRFRLESPEPGSFVLVAAALGYEETRAGVFELGEGASMQLEYRLPSQPLPLDAFFVSVEQPVLDHHLVRSGFVRRLQRGLGKFITPHQIAESSARSTEALLEGIPQVRVGTARVAVGGLNVPAPHLGETVQMARPLGGWCAPRIYVDGQRVIYDPSVGLNISTYVAIADVEAVEVYRRISEIPVEFSTTQEEAGGRGEACGVLVLWTKRGPAPGSRPLFPGERRADGGGLPSVGARGPAPSAGEMIRFDVDEEMAESRGVASPVQGTYRRVDDGLLVVTESATGRSVAVPVESVGALQVSRRQDWGDAWRRGVLIGSGFGVGMWSFLTLLCEWTCGPDGDAQAVLPAAATAILVGGLAVRQGPGDEWVQAPLPGVVGQAPPSRGVGLTLTIPLPRW